MKKLKEKIYGIIILIVCIYLCKNCATNYIKGGDNKAISNYEKMIFDNSTTSAELYPEYREITIKVMGLPAKSYEFRYHFDLEGVKYEGNHTFRVNLPQSNVISVYYLKDDPNFNCVDPQTILKIEKEKSSSKGDLYWSIGWGVFGLLTLIGLILDFRKKEE